LVAESNSLESESESESTIPDEPETGREEKIPMPLLSIAEIPAVKINSKSSFVDKKRRLRIEAEYKKQCRIAHLAAQCEVEENMRIRSKRLAEKRAMLEIEEKKIAASELKISTAPVLNMDRNVAHQSESVCSAEKCNTTSENTCTEEAISHVDQNINEVNHEMEKNYVSTEILNIPEIYPKLIELHLSCEELKDVDFFSKSDPFAVVHYKRTVQIY